jgi:hypothetical protein
MRLAIRQIMPGAHLNTALRRRGRKSRAEYAFNEAAMK